jgi:hypothetical protein
MPASAGQHVNPMRASYIGIEIRGRCSEFAELSVLRRTSEDSELPPSNLHVDGDGNVFVTDENHRVQKFACP